MRLKAIGTLLWVLLFGVVAFTADAAEIRKWVDEKGQTHYGNAVPEAYRQKTSPVDIRGIELTDAQRGEAEDRAAGEKARAETVFARPPRSSEPPARAAASQPVTAATIDHAKRCDVAWQRYRESQACFAPYRNSNGSIKADAFRHCTELQEPVGC